jgi:hypothetical protein
MGVFECSNSEIDNIEIGGGGILVCLNSSTLNVVYITMHEVPIPITMRGHPDMETEGEGGIGIRPRGSKKMMRSLLCNKLLSFSFC